MTLKKTRLISVSCTRRILSAGLLASLLSPLAGVAANAETVIKVGHVETLASSLHVTIEKVAKMVSERSDGELVFQIFPQSQLGSQREMTEAVQLGTLEMTVAPTAFLGGFNPVASITDIPFLYPADTEQAQKIREGEFGKKLCSSFNSHGVTCIGLWPNGRKNFTSNLPLTDMAAFSGQTFRVMESSVLVQQMAAIDVTGVPIPFGDLYTALQTGVVDGEENPLDTIYNMNFHKVQKNLVLSDHGAIEDVVLVNPAFWSNLSEANQTMITQAFAEVIPEMLAHKTAAAANALENIREAGVNIRTMSPEEKEQFRAAMYPAAREAYLDKAGDDGAALIKIYEAEYDKVTQ
ncbi:TRAP transporter substrate-binding protein [Aquicoccus sp. G2-2]|uniref:TRAP transporter substrate-binding protein n=1 Tax=Aquicoccus sp. G2-2 TaxID=3092120 RepID=UPI002ADFB008|nr:TRAP transporter substrate-binding protein [Aquicoccus sp. G2-2]MEA1113920.1 TRAP transporter substrate-binding protein [Aquicoccus sp. G2-2]